jgi:phospholipase/lecithinase/hemolysin
MIDKVESFNIPWLDLRSLFHKELDNKTAQELFIDHVHPTKYGHNLIAMAQKKKKKSILENQMSKN